jgi:hypothetical protein
MPMKLSDLTDYQFLLPDSWKTKVADRDLRLTETEEVILKKLIHEFFLDLDERVR